MFCHSQNDQRTDQQQRSHAVINLLTRAVYQQVASGHSITRLRQSIKVHCTYGIREVYSTGTYQREDLGSSPTGNVDGEHENFLHMHCLCVKHIRSYETTQCEYLDNITAERMSHT